MQIHTLIRLGFSLVLIVIGVLHASGHLRLPVIDALDKWAYDMRLVATMPGGKPDTRVAVIDIDEKSLAEIGRWPWSRKYIGEMVDNLFEVYGIKVLGFDVLFAEPDRSSGLPVLEKMATGPFQDNVGFRETLDRIRPDLEYDRLFAEGLKGHNVILGFAASSDEGAKGALPVPIMSSTDPRLKALNLVERRGVTGNLPVLMESAAGAGYFDNALVDPDGIFRRMPMIYKFGDGVYQSLSLAMFRSMLGNPELQLEFANGRAVGTELVALNFGDVRIPVDQQAAALIPYRGRAYSYLYVSAADIIKKRADPELLKGAMALVGATAAGLLDLRSTPVQNVYPGVEVHANLLGGMLDGRFKQHPKYALGYEAVLLVIFGVLLALLLPRLSAVMSLLLTAVVLLLAAGGNFLVWTQLNLSMPVASQVLLIVLMFMFQMSYSYFVEARSRRQLGAMFGQYVPPEIVEEMDEKMGGEFSMEGEERNMSVLFSDVRSFTTISEQIPANELTEMMNGFLTPMTGVIHHNRGTIDKYMGDCIMAFWGAPLPDADHAVNAVKAGWEMVQSLDQINAGLQEHGWPAIKVGVGVNTGEMRVGNMGSEFRMAYTVMGDSVNLGSRLEGLTKQYGVTMMVSDSTRRQAPGFVYRELDKVRVKGKKEPVAIFEPLGYEDQVDADTMGELKRYKNALDLYRKQQWDQAEMNFASLSAEHPDCLLYKVYLERIPALRQQDLGHGWDAVFDHQTK